MIPLVDVHCHLLAGLDDGPATRQAALEMCRLAYAEGIRWIAATAHQNDRYPDNSPERIRSASRMLADDLRREGLTMTAVPSAEIVVRTDICEAWQRGELLSVADRGRYLLVELPHGLFVEIGFLVRQLRHFGVHVILAHPERHEALLHTPGLIEDLIAEGCLVQASSDSITRPRSKADQRALKRWARRGIIHLLGSDGHNATTRPPRMAAAYEQLATWAGMAYADRVCSSQSLAVLQGVPVRVKPPASNRSWFAWWQTAWSQR